MQIAAVHTIMTSMPSITIRDLPQDVHSTLAARAAAGGRSLQEYLRLELENMARRPTVNEVVERARRRLDAGGGIADADEIVRIIREGRGGIDGQ